MIDTHAHLDALDDAPEALARAREAGVGKVITIGTTLDSCRTELELAEREEGVFVSLGLHPHEAGTAGPADVDELASLLDHPKAVAIGETGLDHFRDYAPSSRRSRRMQPSSCTVSRRSACSARRSNAAGSFPSPAT